MLAVEREPPERVRYGPVPMDRRTRRELMARLSADAERIAARFGLEYASLEAERANVKSRYGICYDDGTIKIRLNSSAGTGHFYVTKKNARTMTEKMSVRKYDPVARKHVEYKEGKIK